MPDPHPNDEPEIADASQLFEDARAGSGASDRSPAGDSAGTGPDGYDLVEHEDQQQETPLPPPVGPSTPPEASPHPARASAGESSYRATSPGAQAQEARVDEVWSRAAEWGPNLILLAIVGFLVIWLIYETLGNPALAFLFFVTGSAALLAISYPIVITLERPVRVTPEQALNDFYESLSHHVPHFRRMWLLLSSSGRMCSAYGSLEGFKLYWKAQLVRLRGNRAGKLTPLVFKVEDFRSEKSAGKTAAEAKYNLLIFLRGRQHEGPLATYPMSATLVRGPDNMWYLNQGTLPDSLK